MVGEEYREVNWPTRLPVWTLLGLVLSGLAAASFGWGWKQWGLDPLERFYLLPYLKTTLPELPRFPWSGPRPPATHLVVVNRSGELAAEGNVRPPLALKWMNFQPGDFDRFLENFIYRRPAGDVIMTPALVCGVLLLAGLIAGSGLDWRRYRRALSGFHRRGSRIVDADEFERQTLGRWRKKKLNSGCR